MSDEDKKPDQPAAATKPKIKTESSVEEAIESVAEQVSRSKSPLLTIAVTLLTGASVGFGGWNTSNAITAQVAALTAKVDKLTEELVEMRKEIAAGTTRAAAERHEDRIRALETRDHDQERTLDKVLLELESLKKAAK